MIFFNDFNRSFSENRYVVFETKEEFENAHYEHHYYKMPQLYKINDYHSVSFDSNFKPSSFPLIVKLSLLQMGIHKGIEIKKSDIERELSKLVSESQDLNALILTMRKQGAE